MSAAAQDSADVGGPRPATIVALLTVAGAVLRLFCLGRLSFWRDEAASVAFASLPWRNLIHLVSTREANMSLYYFILKGWLWFGDSEIWLRGFSVACSVATIPVVYLLGRRLFSAWTGTVAAALFVVNAFSIRYAQETRAYSLGPLMIAVSWLCLVRFIQERRMRDLAGWVASAGLAAYAQLFAALLVPAALLPLWLTIRRRAPWRMIIWATAAIGVLYLPMAVFILQNNKGQVIWIPPISLKTTAAMLFDIMGGSKPHATGALMCLGSAAAFALGIHAMIHAWRRDPEAAMPWALTASGAALPLASVFAISAVQPLLVPRYLTVITPPMVIFAAAGLSTIARPPERILSVVVLVLLALTQDARYFRYATKSDFRDGTGYIVRNSMPGDTVVLAIPDDRLAYDYYRARIPPNDAVPEVTYPRWDGLFRIGGCYYRDVACGSERSAALRSAIAEAIAAHHRLWVIADPDNRLYMSGFAELERPLIEAYGLPACRQFGSLQICVSEPRDEQP
jgi:mannosyltransferase